jgi:hypothetical protein
MYKSTSKVILAFLLTLLLCSNTGVEAARSFNGSSGCTDFSTWPNGTHLQNCTTTVDSSAGTITCLFPHPVGANHLIVGMAYWGGGQDTGTVTAVNDSVSSSYTTLSAQSNAAHFVSQAFYTCATGGAGANTVTATLSAAKTFRRMTLTEYANVNTSSCLDVSAQGQDTSSSNPILSASASTTASGDLLIGLAGKFGSSAFSPGTNGQGGNYFLRSDDVDVTLEDNAAGATNSYSASFTSAIARPWNCQFLAFKTASTISLSPNLLVGGSSDFSVSLWARFTTTNGSNDWDVLNLGFPIVPGGANTGYKIAKLRFVVIGSSGSDCGFDGAYSAGDFLFMGSSAFGGPNTFCLNFGPIDTSGAWHSYVLYQSSATARIYKDGTFLATSPGVASTVDVTGRDLRAGCILSNDGQTNANFSNVTLAEVGIWNVAFTGNFSSTTNYQVKSLAQGYAPPLVQSVGLVFYAPMYGYGSTEADLSGAGRNGTFIGSPALANHSPTGTGQGRTQAR